MRFLLDTQLLLWAAVRPDRLPAAAKPILANPVNALLFSPASLWEVVVKRALGRADFTVEASVLHRELEDHGYEELPIRSEHAVAIAGLPPLHKDPFDRVLVAQATHEGITLLTADALVARYPGPIRKL